MIIRGNAMANHKAVCFIAHQFFYHPDFTVGNGISPFQSRIRRESRTITAGREFLLAEVFS